MTDLIITVEDDLMIQRDLALENLGLKREKRALLRRIAELLRENQVLSARVAELTPADEPEQAPAESAPPLPFPVAVDAAGRPYCADCADSGSGPCAYHTPKSMRRKQR